jgi:hypothetical protein
MRVVIVLAFSACTPQAEDIAGVSTGTGDPPSGEETPLAAGLELISTDGLPNRWAPAAGWEIGPSSVLGDVTGDGRTDAMVFAGTPEGEFKALLIAGPLRRSLTLPGDEVASFRAASDLVAGDITGDGVPEIRMVAGPDHTPFFMEGPFLGEMDPMLAGIPLLETSMHMDVDGDGIMDQIVGSYQHATVTWGPMARWSGMPDLDLELTCGDPNGFTYQTFQVFPDLDGDGRRELRVEDNDNVCASLLFPLPEDSMFAPDGDPATVTGVAPLQAVRDQSSDGADDVWLWQARVVQVAPVTFAGGAVVGASSFTPDVDLTMLYPTAYDLDADGLADFVGLDSEIDDSEVQSSTGSPPDPETGEVLVVIPGGESGLTSPSYSAAWDIAGSAFAGDDVFLEDGVVGILIAHPQADVTVVDLGAGVVVPCPNAFG